MSEASDEKSRPENARPAAADGLSEIQPAEDQPAQEKAMTNQQGSWTSWLKGGSSSKALQTESPARKPENPESEECQQDLPPGVPVEGKGGWRSWVNKAAVSAGSVAGRAVANAKTAAGGASKVAGIVYRTGTGAVSEVRKIAVAARYNDFATSAARLETYAKSMPPEDREMALKRWVAVLRSLRTGEGEPKDEEPKGEDGEEEAEVEGHEDGMEQDLISKAHRVLFYDESVSSEPMNFRGLFLRSQAVEMIALNFLTASPTEEEQALLLQLFDLCMGGSHQQHAAVVDNLVQFSHASQEHRVELAVPQEVLLHLITGAIAKLKLKPDIESIDEQLKAIEEGLLQTLELSENGTDSGGEALETTELAAQGLSLLTKRGEFVKIVRRNEEELEDTVEALELFKKTILKGQEDIEADLADSKLKKLEGDNYRTSKLKEIQKEVNVVSMELAGLHTKKADLEAQLEKVNAAVAKASTRERELEEERLTFEESNTEVLDHLRGAMAGLEAKTVHYTIEGALVRRGLGLMDHIFAVEETTRSGVEKTQGEQVAAAEKSLLRSALWHARCTESTMAKLLAQLQFCASELESLSSKRSKMVEMGMESVLQDLAASEKKLGEKHRQAEREALEALHAHAKLVAKVEAVTREHSWESSVGEMLNADLQQKLQAVREQADMFHSLPRPSEVTRQQKPSDATPPPGSPANDTTSEASDKKEPTESQGDSRSDLETPEKKMPSDSETSAAAMTTAEEVAATPEAPATVKGGRPEVAASADALADSEAVVKASQAAEGIQDPAAEPSDSDDADAWLADEGTSGTAEPSPDEVDEDEEETAGAEGAEAPAAEDTKEAIEPEATPDSQPEPPVSSHAAASAGKKKKNSRRNNK